MVQTAESNGVAWRDQLAWIKEQGPWTLDEHDEKIIPDYYRQPFHAYEDGNLCWESAWEGEIASRAVGARNYPKYGAEGEDAFRGAFDEALASLGAKCPPGGTIVDLGCGSGISTRRLAAAHPQAARILGLDLSPHFLAVGRRLLELAPEAEGVVAPVGQPWVQPLGRDRRIELRHADAARTCLADGEADVVCLSLVIHELPPEVTNVATAATIRFPLTAAASDITVTAAAQRTTTVAGRPRRSRAAVKLPAKLPMPAAAPMPPRMPSCAQPLESCALATNAG
jgi:SAM-dependent methyltransferase